MPIHLLKNTVDIDGRCWFTCSKIRLISTVDDDSPAWNYGRYRIDRQFQEKKIDHRCGFIRKKIGRPRFLDKSKKRPLTYGSIGGEKWSRTHIHQEVVVPCVMRNGPNTYPNVDIYPPIYRPGRLVTVDIDGRCRFTNGELWSIVDHRLKIDIIMLSMHQRHLCMEIYIYIYIFIHTYTC